MSSQPSSKTPKQQPKAEAAKSVAILVPMRWPAWALYLATACVFLAGVGAGLLWMQAPWIVLGLAATILATVLVLRFK